MQIPVDVHVDRDELFQVEARFRGSGSCWPMACCERAKRSCQTLAIASADQPVPSANSIGNGASGPRARLILAGVVLEDATPPEGAWFMNVMPSPRRMLWHAIGGRWYVRYSRSIRRDIR